MSDELWSAEKVDLLRKLWRQGETSAVIAARLGGVSRSAVMGKIFRLRLRAESAIVAALGGQRRATNAGSAGSGALAIPVRRRRRPRSKQPLPPLPPPPVRQHKTLFELTNMTCRWPHGRPGTDKFFFCGAPQADLDRGIPYCAYHMQRAYPRTAGVKPVARAALAVAARR